MVYVVLMIFPETHCRLDTELLNVCKVALHCVWLCMYCSFRRDNDATTIKFLNKNKCNYLQHHTVHNYKFSINIMKCRRKLQSNNPGHCVSGLSHFKLGWKSCIFGSLTPPIAAAILLAPPPPVTAGRRATAAAAVSFTAAQTTVTLSKLKTTE